MKDQDSAEMSEHSMILDCSFQSSFHQDSTPLTFEILTSH
uniref:Uncharacterized protein n=1 Tax=Rhizophora mucronata TaxID=61149 RepID=A0A2P2JNS6_RHIMU